MFGHLHVVSSYSFQNSTIRIPSLVAKAKEIGIQALALCDHHVMYGALEFKKACEKEGIKPIYGLEITVHLNDYEFPLVLLAKNTHGYFGLVKLSSLISTSPNEMIDFYELLPYKNDLFILLSGEQNIIYRLLMKEMQKEALQFFKFLKQQLGTQLLLCIQNYNVALQQQLNQQMLGLATMLNVVVVCSNEVRYLNKPEALTLEYLQASAQGKVLEERVHLIHQEAYLKTEKQMRELFSEEIIDATRRVVLSCQADIPVGELHLPAYPVPNNKSSVDYLIALCQVGLKKRFNGQNIPKHYIERLKDELKIIVDMKFADYFLIVYDYVRYAKSQNILVGPGRGSAAGSLVAYVLGITNIDPVKYDLIFERFLNPERVSMPDIDVDFQDDRREEVVNYVIDKYGHDHVCQIVTFNTYGPKVAIKDLGKAAGLPLVRLEILTKLIPTMGKFKKSAREMYQESNQFQSLVRKDPVMQQLMPSVFVTENLPRNISTHAAGVVLSKEPLDTIVPITLGPSNTIVSQYSKDYIEEVGLLKMDFLGLRNLTILSYILKGIEQHEGIKLDLNQLPLDDQKTYHMIASGDTFGIFQLESDGMVSLLRKMKVNEFEDIIAAIALYRPGPMENIPTYLKRKHKQEPVTYIHEDLKEILEPTYGILIYQEQIMKVAQKMAGFTMGKADILRKAVSKKGSSLMAEMRELFISGAISNGYSQEVATEVYDHIEKFANYGFNRSHSVAYSLVAYQLAYLKAHYPLEFFAALLSHNQSSDHSKLMCMQESRKYGVRILKPSVNLSIDRFKVEDGNIRYSLIAIKEVGVAAYQAIEEERRVNGKFESYKDFVGRMHKLSSKTIEALIDAGALDEFKLPRKMMKINLEMIKDASKQTLATAIEFDLVLEYASDSNMEVLENEKRVLGIYLTTHPVALYRRKLTFKTVQVGYYLDYINQNISSVLCIDRIKTIRDKKGNNMAFLTCYDETGQVDCVLFSDKYAKYQSFLKKGTILVVEGKLSFKDQISLAVAEMKTL